MSQITLYVDGKTLKRIEQAAKREHQSISRWVVMKLNVALEKTWPAGYSDLFGSLADREFKRPEQQNFSDDVRRKSL